MESRLGNKSVFLVVLKNLTKFIYKQFHPQPIENIPHHAHFHQKTLGIRNQYGFGNTTKVKSSSDHRV